MPDALQISSTRAFIAAVAASCSTRVRIGHGGTPPAVVGMPALILVWSAMRSACCALMNAFSPRIFAASMSGFAVLSVRNARANAASEPLPSPRSMSNSPLRMRSSTCFSSRIFAASAARSAGRMSHQSVFEKPSPVDASPSNPSPSKEVTLPFTRAPLRNRVLMLIGFASFSLACNALPGAVALLGTSSARQSGLIAHARQQERVRRRI